MHHFCAASTGFGAFSISAVMPLQKRLEPQTLVNKGPAQVLILPFTYAFFMMRAFPLLLFLLLSAAVQAQLLKPGFDAAEYLELLSVSSRQGDSTLKKDSTPPPSLYAMVYRSPVVGLDNRW